MPAANTLPTDLRALVDINAISVHGDPTFRRDSARLIEAITELVANDRIRAEQERLAALEEARAPRPSDRSVKSVPNGSGPRNEPHAPASRSWKRPPPGVRSRLSEPGSRASLNSSDWPRHRIR